jgi:hypothetical protein
VKTLLIKQASLDVGRNSDQWLADARWGRGPNQQARLAVILDGERVWPSRWTWRASRVDLVRGLSVRVRRLLVLAHWFPR